MPRPSATAAFEPEPPEPLLPDAPEDAAAAREEVIEKPIGAVCDECDAVAAEVAEDSLQAVSVSIYPCEKATERTYAELAALGFESVSKRTRSTMWMTPLGRRTSGWVMSAVMLPSETYWPVPLIENESVSPAVVV